MQAAGEYLSLFAQAAIKARGMLEPLYRLHASRLKALFQPGGASAATLRAVAAHPFLQDTKHLCAVSARADERAHYSTDNPRSRRRAYINQ